MKVLVACRPPSPIGRENLCSGRHEHTATKTYLAVHSHNYFYPAPEMQHENIKHGEMAKSSDIFLDPLKTRNLLIGCIIFFHCPNQIWLIKFARKFTETKYSIQLISSITKMSWLYIFLITYIGGKAKLQYGLRGFLTDLTEKTRNLRHTTHLPNFFHHLRWFHTGGGLHRPGEPKRPRFGA